MYQVINQLGFINVKIALIDDFIETLNAYRIFHISFLLNTTAKLQKKIIFTILCLVISGEMRIFASGLYGKSLFLLK